MYQNNRQGGGNSSYSSRNRGNSNSSGGPRKFNRFRRGGRGGGGRSRNNYGTYIDESKYINRNPEQVAQEEFVPQVSIADLDINPRLKSNILAKGFTALTPIQDRSVPLIIQGRDIIGIANTGTGKTGAFLIPLINKVTQNPNEKVLIIAPTRELAQQINAEFRDFSNGLNLFSVVCIGGTNMFTQRKNLQRSHNFLICTPGRLKDVSTRGMVNLSQYGNVVLDEVDRMFDMGFQKDIKAILSLLPKNRQTLFFSATTSDQIERLFSEHLNNPEKIVVSQTQSAANITQDIVRVTNGASKIDVLHELLIKDELKKVIVFIKTKYQVDGLHKSLVERGHKVDSIHGDKRQGARQRSLANFKESRVNVLLATDVAARGLDIADITHVINYDQPATYDDYMHRIGRTARGTKKGIALTFV